MEVRRIDGGLWRWTAPHPDWKAGADWDEHVGCTYWEADDGIVLVDPLVPADAADRERLFDALDRDVERAAVPVVVLLTCSWHERSAVELAERYGSRVLAPPAGAIWEPPDLPGDASVVYSPAAAELVYWLPAARAVVPGDTLLGVDGDVQLAPDSWLDTGLTRADVARELAPLLELPVERVLVSHGEPVLSGGLEVLRHALTM